MSSSSTSAPSTRRRRTSMSDCGSSGSGPSRPVIDSRRSVSRHPSLDGGRIPASKTILLETATHDPEVAGLGLAADGRFRLENEATGTCEAASASRGRSPAGRLPVVPPPGRSVLSVRSLRRRGREFPSCIDVATRPTGRSRTRLARTTLQRLRTVGRHGRCSGLSKATRRSRTRSFS